LIPYITYREDAEEQPRYYILQKAEPNVIGSLSTIPKSEIVGAIPVTAHNLWVVFAGTLRGNMIPARKGIKEEIESILASMSAWYYENRILKEPKKYIKFKI
jgi:hypothetical protein